MKLAEALLLRGDLQKYLRSLKERITQNTAVQEGETPAEDPNQLLENATQVSGQLRKLAFAVNAVNYARTTAKGRTLTDALAERDALTQLHSIVREAASSSVKAPERYGMKEIRWVRTVDAAGLQAKADDLARQIRELNAEIQAANWEIDIDVRL